MNNADMPAYPAEVSYRDGKVYGVQTTNFTGLEIGLTKRELIASMVASGKVGSPKEIAEHAMQVADELLKQLEK